MSGPRNAIGPDSASPGPAGAVRSGAGADLVRAGLGNAALPAGADVVVVDIETTGLVPEESVIIEIGAVRLSGGRVTGEFFSLVNPAAPIPPDITELTGITDSMVGRAPGPATALRAFLAFARGSVLAAHNAPFDLGFLTRGCQASGVPWPPAAVLDTAVLARLVLGPDEVPDCRLATLADFFAAQPGRRHRALADARATADVLLGLLGMVAARRRGTRPAARPPDPTPPPPPPEPTPTPEPAPTPTPEPALEPAQAAAPAPA